MKIMDFKQSNMTWKGTDKDMGHLPVYCYRDEKRNVDVNISRWQPSFWERVRILFSRTIWIWVWCNQHPPLSVSADNPFTGPTDEQEEKT